MHAIEKNSAKENCCFFKSYITEKIIEKYSDLGSITCGVLQGTALGTILYLIYANDLLIQKRNDLIQGGTKIDPVVRKDNKKA